MRTGWFRQAHVKLRQSRLWRSLLVARRTALNEMRSIENVARAVLRETGLKLGRPARARFDERAQELAGDDATVMAIVAPLPAVLRAMREHRAVLTRQVLAHRAKRGDLPPPDDRAGRRTDHGARLPRHRR